MIQTVGDSPDSSCLSTTALLPDSFFKLEPPVPSQCSGQTISWNPDFYLQPPEIQAFIPGGQAFRLLRPAAATDITWTVDLREGTQVVLVFWPFEAEAVYSITSPLITVTGAQSDLCLQLGGVHGSRTISPTVTALTTALPVSTSTTALPVSTMTESTKKVK